MNKPTLSRRYVNNFAIRGVAAHRNSQNVYNKMLDKIGIV
jgi:hypothetical protein